MNKNKRKGLFRALAVCAVSAAMLATSSCSLPFIGNKGGRPKETIAVITKQQLSFWDDVKKGAEDAGDELGYNILYTVADGDNDYVSQINAIKEAINKGAKAIVIAPNSTTDLNSVFQEAEDKGIKIVNINSRADYDGVASLVRSSDYDSGAVAARNAIKMIKITDPNLSNIGKIAIIGHTASTAEERIQGFTDVITNQYEAVIDVTEEDVELTADDLAEGKTVEEKVEEEKAAQIEKFKKGIEQGERCAKRDAAKEEALKLLKSDGNGITVMLGTNTNTTLGICDAVNELGLGSIVTVVGFNSDEEELGYIRTGVLDGTVIQNPYIMGYVGVRYAHKVVNDQTVPVELDTGSTFVSQSNMTDDYIQLMLYPTKK